LSVFEFKDRLDYSVTEKIYGGHPLLGDVLPESWNVKFTREFDKTNDRDIFNYAGIGIPVLQGANLGFYGEVLEAPTIWVDEDLGRKRLRAVIAKTTGVADLAGVPLDYECYRFGFRRIARATDTRTLYVSWLPKRNFAMYTLTTTVQHYFDGEKFVEYMTQPQQMFLYACMASYCLDFIMRFQVSTSVAMFNAYSLPVPRLTAGNPYFDAIVPRAARLTCTRAEFADLWQAVTGEAWTPASGATDPTERQRLRDEIDALVAHLYGLSRAEFAHILGAFPLVFAEDAAGAGRCCPPRRVPGSLLRRGGRGRRGCWRV
jgi:hypothetical protein